MLDVGLSVRQVLSLSLSSFLIVISGFYLVLQQPLAAQASSIASNSNPGFLTYEDVANGFRIQYPSDWKKSDYPPSIPIVGFTSPAQNATDNLFESIVVAVESLPTKDITLDQYSHSFIEQLRLSNPEFDVISPPKEAMLGGAPAYNMTYTFEPPKGPSHPKLAVMQI
jgi:hypothetical protein